MGRPTGGKNKTWTVEEKYEVIKPVIDGMISSIQRAKDLALAPGMVGNWVIAYGKYGMEGLKSKKKPGNPLAALYTSKSLTNEQRLELENMRLRIENERLKKGYTTEEADRIKKSLGKNTK